MSSKVFKAVFAGAVTAGALFLPVSAAQASTTHHHPCGDGWGFRHHHPHFFPGGHGFGFPGDDGFGFRGHDVGMFDDDDDFGFDPQPIMRDEPPTVIVVNVTKTTKVKGHKKKHHAAAEPADDANANVNGHANGGYGKPAPAAVSNSNHGYSKS